MSNGQYLEGTTLSVTCDPGHLLQGESEITCEASGTWSPQPPSCPGIETNTLFQSIHSDNFTPVPVHFEATLI